MHIPDGFLGPGVAAVTWAAAAGTVAIALREERRAAEPMPSGILGAVAAFLFAAQMINVPVAPGTSGHLIGATLAAVLLGPWRALLAMAAVLLVQAVLFQDGGIAAFGANFVDMGLAGSLVGYGVAHVAIRRGRGPRACVVGSMLGAFAATLFGATLVAFWLSLSGLYPLGGVLPVLLVTHVAIGLLEAALTGAILVTILTRRPDLVAGIGEPARKRHPVAVTAGVFGVALVAAVFLAPLASALPDGLNATAKALGFADRARAMWTAPMPGYDLPWSRLAGVAPALTGSIGTIAVAALAWTISRSLAAGGHDTHR
jgi:cobalt/nickel transport system permease protein